MRVLELLKKAIRDAAVFNPEVQVAPACILWPDRDRQWEAVIAVLQAELPELMILGDYAPDKRMGPAIWLRCVLAKTVVHESHEKHKSEKEKCSCLSCISWTPILYLPGVSRQDLRAIESCPDHLKSLAELQYRGVIWSQINAKDWTILAYLKSDQGGLGLDAAQNNDAKSAMQLALYRLLDEDLALLKGKRLDKDYFNTLLTGGDPIRDLLQWLDQDEAFRTGRGENEWKAFVEVCKSQLAFNPQDEGVLAGAAKLAARQGPWQAVWERFCEAPRRYPAIPQRLRQGAMPPLTLFSDEASHGSWPQWNESREQELRRELLALADLPAHAARTKLLDLEKRHQSRRNLVWAELNEAPLACALEYLAILAETTGTGLAAGSADDLAAGYCHHGWRADDALIRALASIGSAADLAAVSAAVRAVYLPWAEDSARHLQKEVSGASYPGGTCFTSRPLPVVAGECLLFVDGLRFDLGKRLAAELEQAGCRVEEVPFWVPLPSVTATGKPAVAPLPGSCVLGETVEGYNFEPITAYLFQKTMLDKGWKILERADNGDGQGNAWSEFGNIDHEGHDRGWKIAHHLEALLAEIRERITALLAAGWHTVRVVTDHGWLLLPGGLPKIDLPAALVENKWGRCASLKSGATANERLYPWYWNPDRHFALADGISCYKKGEEYTHGGLSLQECLTLQLTVSREGATGPVAAVEITDLVWRGLRCTVAVDGAFSGLSVDLRTLAGNPESSVLVGCKPLKENGAASVIVENEELEGEPVTLVLFDGAGALVAQVATIIGGGKE